MNDIHSVWVIWDSLYGTLDKNKHGTWDSMYWVMKLVSNFFPSGMSLINHTACKVRGEIGPDHYFSTLVINSNSPLFGIVYLPLIQL